MKRELIVNVRHHGDQLDAVVYQVTYPDGARPVNRLVCHWWGTAQEFGVLKAVSELFAPMLPGETTVLWAGAPVEAFALPVQVRAIVRPLGSLLKRFLKA